MLSLTNSMARCWSHSPALPGAASSAVNANPIAKECNFDEFEELYLGYFNELYYSCLLCISGTHNDSAVKPFIAFNYR